MDRHQCRRYGVGFLSGISVFPWLCSSYVPACICPSSDHQFEDPRSTRAKQARDCLQFKHEPHRFRPSSTSAGAIESLVFYSERSIIETPYAILNTVLPPLVLAVHADAPYGGGIYVSHLLIDTFFAPAST